MSVFPAELPASLDDPEVIREHDWQAFRQLTYMENHWDRPGWNPGRRSYHWMLTFDGADEVQQLVKRCQAQLPATKLDPVPLDALHLTIGRIGFTDEVTETSVRVIAEEATRHLDLKPFVLSVGPLAGSSGAARFSVAPWSPLHELHQQLISAAGAALARNPAPVGTAARTGEGTPVQPYGQHGQHGQGNQHGQGRPNGQQPYGAPPPGYGQQSPQGQPQQQGPHPGYAQGGQKGLGTPPQGFAPGYGQPQGQGPYQQVPMAQQQPPHGYGPPQGDPMRMRPQAPAGSSPFTQPESGSKKWMIWVGVAALVVAGVVLTLVLLLGGDDEQGSGDAPVPEPDATAPPIPVGPGDSSPSQGNAPAERGSPPPTSIPVVPGN